MKRPTRADKAGHKKEVKIMNSNWTDLFKANLVKPAWADNAKETEIPFVVHSIDACIGTNWREDGNNDEQLFGNSDRNRPGQR